MAETVSQFAGIYREWAPAEALREHVHRLWVNDLSRMSTDPFVVVPDGCVDIVWTGSDLVVAGPDTRPILTHFRTPTIVAGARFHPGAALAWLGVPMSEIANTRVPLSEFWRGEARRMTDVAASSTSGPELAAKLESALLKKLGSISSQSRQVAFIRAAGKEDCESAPASVSSLAAAMGVSERTLRRRCMDAFGYSFQTLCRVLRFERFMRLATCSTDRGLAELAARAGYADQPHLTREVRRMSGATPGEFVAQIRP